MNQAASEKGGIFCRGTYLDPLVDPLVEVPANKRYTLGLDLAKARDFAALAVVEGQMWESRQRCQLCFEPHRWTRQGLVRIERIPRGTTYPAIVDRVAVVMRSRHLVGRCRVVIDETGVGAPVVDLISAEGDLPYIGVLLSGGGGLTMKSPRLAVASKVAAVSKLTADLQGGGLHIAPDCPGAELLASELAELRQKTSAAGRVSMEASPGEYDDLVMALALANLFAGYQPPKIGWGRVPII
jgi:hypothetical protein